MQRIRLWLDYRKQGLRNAWNLAGMSAILGGAVKGLILGCIFVAAVLAVTGQAQAIQEDADNRVAADRANMKVYVKALEQVVASCLSDATGKPVQIGDTMYLCGIVEVGKIK